MISYAFAGTPSFASTILPGIISAGIPPPLWVLSQPDTRAGRGMKYTGSPVCEMARRHAWILSQPHSLKQGLEDVEKVQELLDTHPVDLIVVAAYGLILPKWLLESPRYGCINVHASLLPRWRGAAPVARAIEAGDTHTGVCIMQMEEGLDTGPILHQAQCPISPDDTTASLTHTLAVLGVQQLVEVLHHLAGPQGEQSLHPEIQAREGVSYAHKLHRHQGILDFHCTADELERRARAFDPFPGVSILVPEHSLPTKHDGAVLKGNPINLKVSGLRSVPAKELLAETRSAYSPGQVCAIEPEGLVVSCGGGSRLCIHSLQKPGGRRMPAREFLLGFPSLGVGAQCYFPSDISSV